MNKIYKLVLFVTMMVSYSIHADSVLATISNVSLGPSFRSSGAVLMPTNSWLSPITIPSSPISSPLGSSSTSIGISFGEISGGTASLAPISQVSTSSTASSSVAVDSLIGTLLGY